MTGEENGDLNEYARRFLFGIHMPILGLMASVNLIWGLQAALMVPVVLGGSMGSWRLYRMASAGGGD